MKGGVPSRSAPKHCIIIHEKNATHIFGIVKGRRLVEMHHFVVDEDGVFTRSSIWKKLRYSLERCRGRIFIFTRLPRYASESWIGRTKSEFQRAFEEAQNFVEVRQERNLRRSVIREGLVWLLPEERELLAEKKSEFGEELSE